MAACCERCGAVVDGFNGQMVMLRHYLWRSVSNGRWILCLNCIEEILKRNLTVEDLLFKRVKGEIQWIPVNYQFIRGKEIGISKAREEIFTMRKGIHYVIPFRDFNKFEFNSDNLSISSYLPINR